jgi:ribosomal protein L7/L12/uncharacterized protein YegL
MVDQEPFELAGALDRRKLPSGASTEVKCQIRLRARPLRSAPGVTAAASSICLLFDCSASMLGRRLTTASEAAHRIVESLHERHRISVVGFGSRAQVVIDNAQATAAERPVILQQIGAIRSFAGGSTNLAAGIEEAARVVTRHPADARVIVLLSDGQADSAQKAEKAALAATAAGVQLFAVGIGADYQADHMLKLVTPSMGAVFGDTDLAEVKASLAGIVERIDRFVATSARLTVSFGEDVVPGPAYKTSPERAFLGDLAPPARAPVELNVGNIEAGQTYAFLLVATCPPRGRGPFEVARATLTCDVRALGLRGHEQTVAIDVDYDDEGAVQWSGDVATAYRAARMAQLAQVLAEAQRRGDAKTSIDCLEHLLRHADEVGDARMKAQYQRLLGRVRGGEDITNEMINALVVGSTAKAPAPATDLYDVVLLEAGEQIIRVVRDVRDVTGLGLRDVSNLVKAAPSTIGPPLQRADAEGLVAKLLTAGARAELRPHEGPTASP